ncbi:MAG: ATP-binding protein [Alphaproteobacteria bacterium]
MTGRPVRCILLLAFCFLLLIGPPVRAQDTIELYPETSPAPFHAKIWYLFDEAGDMPLDAVLAHPGRFQRNLSGQINFGITGAVIWLRLDVANAGGKPGEWLLGTLLRSAEILDIYLLHDGKAELLFSATDTAAASAALQTYNMLAVKIRLAPGKGGALYIRYHSQNITRLPLKITTFAEAAEEKQNNYVIFTIVAASVATFAVYSTAIFLFIGGRAILYYAIAEMAMVLLLANFDGILSISFGSYTPVIRLVAPAVFSGLNIIFTTLFARNFFPLRTLAPRVDLFLRCMLWAGFAYLAATGLFAGWPEIFDLVQIIPYILLAALWLFLPLLAIHATVRWRTSYWPLIPGLFSVLFAHGYWILIVANLVPEPPFPPRLLGLNFVFQGFFMAIAIVLQVRQLRDDRLQAELDLNAALQQQLAAANRNAVMLREMADQGRLVQAAGHDTRSILYGLRNLAYSLKQDVDAAQVSHAALEIGYLTDDLEAVFSTTIAGAVSGGHEDILAIEYVAMERVLSAAQLIHERQARHKGLRFEVYGGAHNLVTDRALLGRILGNLIENACRYTERGGVILAARRCGDCLRLQVWDSGCGVEDDLLARLLDPDAGQQRGADAGPGRGSGLQTAKLLAARLGGSIAACSRPGHGSRFELVLPMRSAPRTTIAARLWILDGNAQHAQKLQAMAHGIGLDCTVISAREFAQEFGQPGISANDLALIDLHFGGALGGIDAAARLGALLPRSNISICTYDQGVDVRAKLAPVAGVILYQPVSQQALVFMSGIKV